MIGDEETIAEYVIRQLQWHEDVIEECTCSDPDAYSCWWHFSAKEMHRARLEFLIGKLQEEVDNND